MPSYSNVVRFQASQLWRAEGGTRTQPQQIHHHHFAVVVPAILQEAAFRPPPVRQNRRIFREPAPVHAIKDFGGQRADFGVREMLPAGEDPAEKNRGVNGGDFRIPQSLARIDIGPVIEKAAMIGKFSSNESAAYSARVLCASAWEINPRFSPMQSAVRPKPVAAMLPKSLLSGLLTLQRSLTMPVSGFACSQK